MSASADRRPYALSVLGPTQPWQATLLLPERYQDLSRPAESVQDFENDQDRRPIRVEISSMPAERWPSPGSRGPRRPRTVFQVVTPAGEEVQATVFGDTREQREAWKPGVALTCLASCSWWNDRASLVLHEFLDPNVVGRPQPLYAGKPRAITPDEVRDHVLAQIPDGVGRGAQFLRDQLASIGPWEDVLRDMGGDGWTLEQLIEQSHAPVSLAHGEHAGRVLRRIGALVALNRMPGARREPAAPLPLKTLARRIAALPYQLTQDQATSIAEIAAEMQRPVRSFRLLAGDVGTGKTLVALALAIAAHDGGARVVIMAPTSRLASQICLEARELFPDVSIALITGETNEPVPAGTRWWIGTSALLFRGLEPPELWICDEQHKFSRAQREQLVGPNTHVLEMTATPIPRTQALTQYGGCGVSRMRQTHAPKTFITTLYEGREAMRAFFHKIAPSLRGGDRLLVVYPRREATEEGEQTTTPGSDRYAVDRAFERWNELYPGKVACLTSDDDGDAKSRALADFDSGIRPLLICTTVVETGLTLPSLHRIAIVCPERYGLVTLAQLRGRTARHGGEGYCELLCPEPISPPARARLETFVKVVDGFELAEMDWHARGAGDLAANSDRQTGADGSCLFGVRLNAQLLEEALPVYERYCPRG